MEFYEVFISFLAILKRSIKIFLKNWKSLAPITILSQILISILILLFSCLFKSWVSYIHDATWNSQSTAIKIGWIYLVLLLVVEFALVFVFFTIHKFSSVAIILISVMSCGEKKLSLQDLISRITKTWKRLQVAGWDVSNFKRDRDQYWLFLGFLGIIPWLLKPNLITLLIAIFVGVITLVFFMYLVVDFILATVVLVVEENCKGQKALEKSDQLIEGHKIHGFLLNILFSLLVSICFLGYWMIVGDNWILNLTEFVLFLANIAFLGIMLELVAYTVLYSEGKKRCGEEIEILGFMEDTKTKLSNDIP